MFSSIANRSNTGPLCAALCLALALESATSESSAATVQNCGDGGPGSGSLRDVIANAQPGDTIDLSQLPTKCGMTDSVVTLSNGEIVVSQSDLTLQGPSVGSVTVKPAADHPSRVFKHTGQGTLSINDLTVSNGTVDAAGLIVGGCIASEGDVFLSHTAVTDCAVSGGDHGFGGGVFASGSAVVQYSSISSSSASGSSAGDGGGIYVGKSLLLAESSISGNSANAVGGGVYVYAMGGGSATVKYSTIDNNNARFCGGAALQVASSLSNVTISDNTASTNTGGLCLFDGQSQIRNSTVAFNSAGDCAGGIGLRLGSLDLQSTIVARNNSSLCAQDLYTYSGGGAVSGSDNLIVSADGNVPPSAIKLTSDPLLGPLQINGGMIRTRALLPDSPAIGAGSNNANLNWDERSTGYRRSSNLGTTDIGAFQFDWIFVNNFEP
jgi:parallel beta-helix repeat protein